MTVKKTGSILSKKPKHEEQKGSTEHLDPEYEKLLKTDPTKGLSDAEIEDRLARFGPNGNDIHGKRFNFYDFRIT